MHTKQFFFFFLESFLDIKKALDVLVGKIPTENKFLIYIYILQDYQDY